MSPFRTGRRRAGVVRPGCGAPLARPARHAGTAL